MSRSRAVPISVALAVTLWAAAPGISAGLAPEAPAPECGNRPPRVLNVGLPYSEGLELEDLEGALEGSLARRFLHGSARGAAPEAADPCGERPLQINVALGSPYQVLDWLDRGLVDMAVVSVLGLHLLRRDGVDLMEVEDSERAGLEPLVGRVPELTLMHREGREETSRSGHDRHLRAFAGDLWREAVLGEEPAPRPGVPRVERLVVPDHLSTAGFLMPVLEIEEELDALAGDAEPSIEERRRFWDAFYGRLCFRFSERLGRRAGTACDPTEDGAVLEIATRVEDEDDLVPGGATVAGPPVLGARAAYRDRLVIRRAVAEELFGEWAADSAEAPLDVELLQLMVLFDRTVKDRLGREVRVPTAFDGFLTPDAYFGTRPFAFTVGESLDLIEHDQWISSRSQLALVLPGGGVKAAYQSRVLDELYRRGHLRNAGLPDEPRQGGGALGVRSVVGTSGGALLGFFVARLGESGPWNLSDVLWRPDGPGAGSERYLTSSEVFGWTDLPRYVSLLVILLVFTAVLGVSSLRRQGFLAPERLPGEWPERQPAARPRLFLLLAAVLGLTPLLVRWVNGPVSQEHVPEFEGLLYAVLVVLAMFADQCLVWTEKESVPPASRRLWAPPGLLVAAGLTLAGLPVLLRPVPAAGEWLEGEVGAGAAYLVLGLLAAGLALAAVRRRVGAADRAGEAALWIVSFAAGSAAALGLLRLSGREFLERLDRTPLLFLALFAALLVTAVLRYTGGEDAGLGTGRISRGYSAFQSWFIRLSVTGKLRTAAAVLVPPLVCLIVLDLTRPEADAFLRLGLGELLFVPSKLHSPRGALAVCLGAVLLAVGALLTLHERRNHYRLEGTERFRDAVALVIVGLAFTVYAALTAIVLVVGWIDARGWLDGSELFAAVAQLTLFELTPAFWIGLVAVSAAASVLAVRWARAGRFRGGRIGGFLDSSLSYLCSRHPNGHLVPRRFIRLIAFGVVGLAWWNFLLAPALYGNRYAVSYLKAADRRFETAFCRSTGRSEEECARVDRKPLSDALTARYLVPANALAIDGTRFVLAVPGDEECPSVPASPGVTWRRFHAVHAADAHAAEEDSGGCEDLDLSVPAQRDILTDYVFASGSPFPAFPPRRVLVHPEQETREALVDGGYSNNVPLEAAAKVGAEQALVIHSSNPAPPPAGGGWLTALGGPLVDNLPRLVGFLYQRSQQLDRRSGTSLFVVSLAPPYRPDWPLLTDFRSSTVERMLCTAEEDLGLPSERCGRSGAAGAGRRIGMVESWGPPRIQESFEMTEEEISVERGRAREGARAIPGGPPPPSRVLAR